MTQYRVVMYCPFTQLWPRHLGAGPETLTDRVGDGVADRLRNLQEMISQGALMIREGDPDAPPDPPTFFLAPEWYFRPAEYGYTEDDLVRIVQSMLDFSKGPGLQNTVIVCGSVYWGYEIGTHSRVVWGEDGEKVWAAKPVWSVYNCAPVIRNGSLLALVFKRWEDDVLDDRYWFEKWGMYGDERWRGAPTPKTVTEEQRNTIATREASMLTRMRGLFGAGLEIGGRLRVDGVNVGVEICADQNFGRLKTALGKDGRSPEWADVEVVISGGTTATRTTSCTKRNGFVLHCDGGKNDPEGNFLRASLVRRCTGWAVGAAEWGPGRAEKIAGPTPESGIMERTILFTKPITVPAAEASSAEVVEDVAAFTTS